MRTYLLLTALLSLLCCRVEAQESARPGRWHDPSTWSGGLIPGDGGEVVISHAVVLDGDATIGRGGPAGSTPALLLRPGGGLAISEGRALRARGDVIADDAEIAMERGSALELRSSGAAYSLRIGGASGARARLVANGTAEAPSAIRSIGGAGRMEVARTGSLLLSGTSIEGMGDGNEPAISVAPGESSIVSLEGVVFEGGGGLVTSGAIPASGVFSLRQVTFRATRSEQALVVTAHDARLGGARDISSCVFDKEVRFWPGRGFSVTGSVFLSAFEVLEGAWDLFEGNFVRTLGSDLRIAGGTSRNYWLVDNPGLENPHFLQALSFAGRISISEDIFEFDGSDANGDCIMAGLPPAPSTLTISRNIVLPNAAGDSSCTLFSLLGSPNVTVIAEHNTYIVGSQGAAVGETYAGHPGMLSSFRSNLAWDTVSRGFKLYDSGRNETVIDLVRSEAADYNGGWGFLEGSNGKGYDNLETSSGSPGRHDVLAEPHFRDPGRDIASWDRSLGGPGTVQNALSLLGAMNGPGGGAYSPAALAAYVRQGFVPQNPALRGAGHDGLDIGALQVGAVIPTPTPQQPSGPGASPPATAPPGGEGGPPGGGGPNTPGQGDPRPGPSVTPPAHETPQVETPSCRCHVRCRRIGARRRCARHLRCGDEVTVIRGIKCRKNARVNARMRCSKRFRRACHG